MNRRRLGCLSPHYGHCADAVLRAARDNPVTVGYIDKDIALAIKEAHDLKRLEYKAAVFVEDALTILELARGAHRRRISKDVMISLCFIDHFLLTSTHELYLLRRLISELQVSGQNGGYCACLRIAVRLD